MHWNDDIDLDRRRLTSREIVKAAKLRGWQIASFDTNNAIFMIKISPDTKPIYIFSAAPPQTSYPASKIANDKFITNQILAYGGLPVPSEILLQKDENLADQGVLDFITKHRKIVFKPLDASHGKGVIAGITTYEEVEMCMATLATVSKTTSALIQEYVEGVDIRIVTIGYKYANAISRIPARVIGDGESTVYQLIENTNLSSSRGENYRSELNKIPLARAKRYLQDKINDIPHRDEYVQVVDISNIGEGGERLNITKAIPQCLIDLAEQASRMLDLSVCGVDILTAHSPDRSSTLQTLQPKIIELNSCPGLVQYTDLNSPEQMALIDQYLDYLLENIDTSTQKMLKY